MTATVAHLVPETVAVFSPIDTFANKFGDDFAAGDPGLRAAPTRKYARSVTRTTSGDFL